MTKPWLLIAIALTIPSFVSITTRPTDAAPPAAVHRSPCDIALFPGGRLALTANHTSDSASLVDVVTGKVLDEQSCGRKPAGVACAADGRRAAVSNLWSGTLTLLEAANDSLQAVGEMKIGAMPRGL